MNPEIYAHFHPDERLFVDKAWEWVDKAANHEMKRTDFLDPRQAFILTSLANRRPEVCVRLDGGYAGAERRRAIVGPDYRSLDDEDIGIVVLSITSADAKIASLDHGDYLGAILGVGIKREKIGDLHVLEQGCHCLVSSEIAEFVRMQLHQVHRVHVQTELLPIERLRTAESALQEMSLTVASLRLDGIVSDVFHLSRSKVLTPIKAGRCRVNWKVEENASALLKAGDVVSLQGFGRFKVTEVEGTTKKGRIRVKVGKYV